MNGLGLRVHQFRDDAQEAIPLSAGKQRGSCRSLALHDPFHSELKGRVLAPGESGTKAKGRLLKPMGS